VRRQGSPENVLGDIRVEKSQAEQLANVVLRATFLFSEVGDRGRLALFEFLSPGVGPGHGLDERPVEAGFVIMIISIG
jgi:hypothetical protein